MDEDLAKALQRLRVGMDKVSNTLEEASGRAVGLINTLTDITDYISEEIGELLDAPVWIEENPSREDKIAYIRNNLKETFNYPSVWDQDHFVEKLDDEDIDFTYSQLKKAEDGLL